jgi:membrane protein required for colicin V production
MERGIDCDRGLEVTLYDLIAVAILIASGAVGYVRGGMRELVTVIAFILAVVIAVVGLRVSAPIARHAIHLHFLANAAAILAVFFVAYAVLIAAGHALIGKLSGAHATSPANRGLGVAFGLLRGVIALGVLYLVFNAATPPERVPRWIKDAALYPLSGTAGHVLMALAPEGSAVAHNVEGYDAASRKSVDDLVEKTR